MASRSRAVVGYAGAAGKLAIERVATLGPRFMLQEKVDGQYVTLSVDRTGRVANVFGRTGEPVTHQHAQALIGCKILGGPALVCGELEAPYTDGGRRAIERRGFALVHLFDAINVGGRYLARMPYEARRDALWRSRALVNDARGYTRDAQGRAHDRRSGRFRSKAPRGYERAPIVEQYPLSRAADLWDLATTGEAEGFVAVAQDAPMGARRSKLKVKPVHTIDATVLQVSERLVSLWWPGRGMHLVTGRGPRGLDLRPGVVVSVACHGWYDSGLPRHARITRVRHDLTGPGPATPEIGATA